jgi:hypothetical protein
MQCRVENEARSGFSSIDELLGDAKTRFFGAGFRMVRQELFDISVDTVERTACGSGTIQYPAAWSTKKTRELKPHLSSLDALMIGAGLAEVYLRSAFAIEGSAADRMWLTRCTLKAGSNPTLDLANVPAMCTLVDTKRSASSLCGYVSSFAVQVGSIGLELAIDHPLVQLRNVAERWSDVNEVLGPPESRYFGSAYAATELRLHQLEFQADRAQALLDQEEPAPPKLQGMGAAYAPFVSAANTIVGIAQLAQALLYLYDNISREVSHNLWMRKIALEHPRPVRSGRDMPVETWSTKMSLLSIKDAMWRTGSFALAMPGVTGTYTLAHQLPREFKSPNP